MPSAKPNPRLVLLLKSALRQRAEISLRGLFGALELSPDLSTLEKLVEAKEFCNLYGLELVPSIEQGDLECLRCLRFTEQRGLTEDDIKQEIRSEGQNLELKSSLLYDRQKAEYCPTAPIDDLKSDLVTHGALKTIAAFLNSGGGILYVGIDDHERAVGIEDDFVFLKADKRNSDGWQLHLRDLIKDRFHEGASINDYVRVSISPVDKKLVARVEVSFRRKMSFLKNKSSGGSALCRRQGNRTVEVPIEQIEEFLTVRQSEAS
jgi:Schlafen, AlbA_2